MISDYTLYQIKDAINDIPELNGCKIGFHGNLQSKIIDTGNPNSKNYHITVIIEETHADIAPKVSNEYIKLPHPEIVLNKTVAGAELKGAGLTCGFAALSGLAVVGSVAAEVPSFGTSTVLLIAAWTGFVTQSIQCVNGITRAVEVYRNPDENSIQRWDGNEWYSNTFKVINDIDLISGVISISGAAKNVRNMLILKGALPEEAIKTMTNAQKIDAYKRAIKKISENPVLASEFENLLKKMGPRVANRLKRNNEVIIRRSTLGLSKLVSEHTLKSLMSSVKEIFINSLSIGTGALPQKEVGSASGSVNWAINQIDNLVINIVEN